MEVERLGAQDDVDGIDTRFAQYCMFQGRRGSLKCAG